MNAPTNPVGQNELHALPTVPSAADVEEQTTTPCMPFGQRVTTREIAARVGCHYSTVSLALRNHPRIRTATRLRVQEVAKSLGYRPDAMLAALCAYKTTRSPSQGRSVLAWMTNHRTRNGWRSSACNMDYWEGARARAEERGYRIEEFWLAEHGMSGRRMSDILVTRSIQGVLLPPQEKIGTIDLKWSAFSAVTFGYTLTHPRLHLVSNHEYRTMGTLFHELARRGYGRIGLVDLEEDDRRVDHNWIAAYLVEQRRMQEIDQIPPLISVDWSDSAFAQWVNRHRPDAIVTRLPWVVDLLSSLGLRVPDDLGVAFHSLDERTTGLSGMKKNAFQIGTMAVDLVIDMLHRNERGIPCSPHLSMVEGLWTEGETLRSLRQAEALDC